MQLSQDNAITKVIKSVINSDNILDALSKLNLPNSVLYAILMRGLSNNRKLTVWYNLERFRSTGSDIWIEFNVDNYFNPDTRNNWDSMEIDFDHTRYIFLTQDDVMDYKQIHWPYYGFCITISNNVVSITQSGLEGYYSTDILKDDKIHIVSAYHHELLSLV